jgi:hypothetical protein
MIQAVIAILNIYELSLFIAAFIGVIYDFCRSTFSTRTTVPDI